jgi:hypothetical protein
LEFSPGPDTNTFSHAHRSAGTFAHIRPTSALNIEKKGNSETSATQYNSIQCENLKAKLPLPVNHLQRLNQLLQAASIFIYLYFI